MRKIANKVCVVGDGEKISAKRPVYLQKRPVYLQKKHTNLQKRPVIFKRNLDILVKKEVRTE